MAEFSHRSLHGARAGRRRLLAATFLVVFLIVLDIVTGGSVRSLIRTGATTLWSATARARAGIIETGYFRSHRALASENASLRDEVASLQEKAAQYNVVADENTQLRDLVHLASTERGITAPVVSSFRSSPYGTFLIGAGKNDPVAAGDIVLTPGGFVIGIIADVQDRTSAVRGIFSSGMTSDVLIGTTPVTLTGEGGGNAKGSAPRGVSIQAGDPVIARQYGGRPVGIVGKVESSPTSPDQTVYVRIPVNLESLRFVYILHA
ncbi:MAG: rod shape-determining protein MreC [Candidatus Kaiserbacteria bacterium]|nr:rod shape-determining protein MreC [Candidatus Kaiserbacteria bacterium]